MPEEAKNDRTKQKELSDNQLDKASGAAGYQDRAYVAGRFALTIDGQVGGFVKGDGTQELKDEELEHASGGGVFQNVDGLSVEAEVLEYQEGGENTHAHKTPGPTRSRK